MHKLKFLVVLVCAMLVFGACVSPKVSLTAEEFTLIMEEAGHTVTDFTDLIGVTFLVAETENFQVEFTVFDLEADAMRAYNQIQRYFEDGRGNSRSYRTMSGMNFNRFSKTTGGRFEAITRVGNTLVQIETSVGNRPEAQAILELLRY